MRAPIIIIGAPRSGTNMLRDVLCVLDDLTTWSCDEINYIWRYGNRAYPNDQFPRSLATPKVQKYIRKQFAKHSKTKRIVEKTCANSLRVEFVNEVFPNAQFIFILRDGCDAAASATIKSQKSVNYAYLWTKVRFVPVSDIYYYVFRFFLARIGCVVSKNGTPKNWGPVPEIDFQIDGRPTALQVSAHQWAECVKVSKIQLDKLGSDRYITVNYEDLVASPLSNFTRILDFLSINIPPNISSVLSSIKNDSVGKASRVLSSSEQDSIRAIVDAVTFFRDCQVEVHG